MEEKSSNVEKIFSKRIKINAIVLLLMFILIECLFFVATEGNMFLVIIEGICLSLPIISVIKVEYDLLEGYSLMALNNRGLERIEKYKDSPKNNSKGISNDELVKTIQEKCISEIKNLYEFGRDNGFLTESVNISLPYISSIIDSFILMYMMILDSDESFNIFGFSRSEAIYYNANNLVKKIFESFEYDDDYWKLLPKSSEYIDEKLDIKRINY